MGEALNCPRRGEAEADEYPEHDHWRDDRTCSFCGSARPEDFMAAAGAGKRLEPTDEGDVVYCRSLGTPTGKFYLQHLDPAQRSVFLALLEGKTLNLVAPFDPPPRFDAPGPAT